MLPKPILSLILLILLGMIWGTGYSIAKFAMNNGVPPLGYSFWQSLGPAILLSFIIFFHRKKINVTVKNSRYYLVCGFTGIVIPNTSMYFAAAHLPANILALIVNTVPILAYPMALFARVEFFNWKRILGIALALIGLLFIIIPKSSLPSKNMEPWVLSALITPISFAFCSIYIARNRPKDCDVLSMTTGMLISASLLLIPLVLYKHNFYFFNLPFKMADWIIILEIILSSIGYLLFFLLIKLAGPVYYSLVDTVVVITGIFWGCVIFGEQLNQWTLTAVCLIILALLVVTKEQYKSKAYHEHT